MCEEKSRKVAFLATVFSTVALLVTVITLPIFYLHMQKVRTLMLGEVAYCKATSRDIWKQMLALEITRTSRTARQVPSAFADRLHQGNPTGQIRLPARQPGFIPWRHPGISGISPGISSDPDIAALQFGEDFSKKKDPNFEAPLGSNPFTNLAVEGSDGRNSKVDDKLSLDEEEVPEVVRSNPGEWKADACCTCQMGMPGKPGRAGKNGEPGRKGTPGGPGKDGVSGYVLMEERKKKEGKKESCQICNPGKIGPPGVAGPKGPRGKPGFEGAPGKDATPGQRGAIGPQGQRGTPGKPGAKGPAGEPGKVLNGAPPGPPGAPGLVGARGRPGPAGYDGKPGRRGLPGNMGPVGYRGQDGTPGLPGPPGPSGIPGPPGTCSHCTVEAANSPVKKLQGAAPRKPYNESYRRSEKAVPIAPPPPTVPLPPIVPPPPTVELPPIPPPPPQLAVLSPNPESSPLAPIIASEPQVVYESRPAPPRPAAAASETQRSAPVPASYKQKQSVRSPVAVENDRAELQKSPEPLQYIPTWEYSNGNPDLREKVFISQGVDEHGNTVQYLHSRPGFVKERNGEIVYTDKVIEHDESQSGRPAPDEFVDQSSSISLDSFKEQDPFFLLPLSLVNEQQPKNVVPAAGRTSQVFVNLPPLPPALETSHRSQPPQQPAAQRERAPERESPSLKSSQLTEENFVAAPNQQDIERLMQPLYSIPPPPPPGWRPSTFAEAVAALTGSLRTRSSAVPSYSVAAAMQPPHAAHPPPPPLPPPPPPAPYRPPPGFPPAPNGDPQVPYEAKIVLEPADIEGSPPVALVHKEPAAKRSNVPVDHVPDYEFSKSRGDARAALYQEQIQGNPALYARNPEQTNTRLDVDIDPLDPDISPQARHNLFRIARLPRY